MRKKLFAGETPALLIARVSLGFSWIYQGAVPKIACQSPGEIELIGHVIGIYEYACRFVTVMGYAEIVFGIVLLFTRWVWVFVANSAALLMLLVYVAVFQSDLFTLPFNPLTLNIALIGLSCIAFLELKKTSSDL
ncbi:MAG: DoxX-like family protein [Prosthecochloris sp.]|nr:DoxX-like family protein [Prosthecochloris sp.]